MRSRITFILDQDSVSGLTAYFKAAVFLTIVSVTCYALLPFVGYRAMGSVFLLSILVVSIIASRTVVFFAALICALVWNFFFIPPQLTFAIHAWEDIMMVISFFGTALIAGFLSEAAHSAKLYRTSETLHQTLLNSVSHELRTPLTAIIGSASALKDSATQSNCNAREALTDELIRSALRLDRVVENLLDLTRLQKGTLQLKKEWFDLGDLFASIKNAVKDDPQKQRLRLTRDESVLIEGDFYLLSHALNQLVLNATRYSPDSTKIEIESWAENARAKIIVRDEGAGIPHGLERKIFEKFYRVPGTPAGGLGLGLSIANNIVELHGGTLSARNRTDTHGAIFEISLPANPTPEALQKALE